jgi:thiamine kinase-like enzyme
MLFPPEVLEEYYVKASKIPKATTMRSLGCEGYIMNDPLHGNENLIICFDKEARHLFKRLSNEDEIHRVQRNCSDIMPMFPSTLHSLTLDQRHTEIFGKLISQISEALEALHAIQFCHMDIKPSNIAIDNEGLLPLVSRLKALIYTSLQRMLALMDVTLPLKREIG